MSDVHTLKQQVALFPPRPGVYFMKNEQNILLYVGKAKQLRKRVQSYLRPQNNGKVALLMQQVHSIAYQPTNTEYEALLLEHNLIKEYHPKFNTSLKDDKTFPMIKITHEPFPRVIKTRQMTQDKGEYYGPYIDVGMLHKYLTFIEKTYPLRKCKHIKKRSTPCLYYHLGRCAAVCADKTTHDIYMKRVQAIKKILQGDVKNIKHSLQKKMHTAAKKLEFEEAQSIKNSLDGLNAVFEHTEIYHTKGNRDFVNFVSYQNKGCISTLHFHEAKLVHQHIAHITVFDSISDSVEQFLMNYYHSNAWNTEHLFTPIEMSNTLTAFFEHELHITISLPLIPQDANTIKIAYDIAQQGIQTQITKQDVTVILQSLQQVLSLGDLPTYIEGFDIATIHGYHSIASMVYFEHGIPNKKQYRSYTIKSLKEGTVNDYQSLQEVVSRRYTRLLNEKRTLPNLIVIDGGQGQVNSVYSVLQALDLSIPVIGLAKKHEHIYFPHNAEPLELPKHHAASRILQHIRNEAHHFAIRLRASRQKKSLSFTMFTAIPSIGTKKAKQIFELYPNLHHIIDTPIPVLANSIKISQDTAQQLQEHVTILVNTNKKPLS